MAGPDMYTRKTLAKQGKAMPNGSSGDGSIRNEADARKAIQAAGQAKGGEAGRAAVRRFIMKRLIALGLTRLKPANWNPDGSLKQQ